MEWTLNEWPHRSYPKNPPPIIVRIRTQRTDERVLSILHFNSSNKIYVYRKLILLMPLTSTLWKSIARCYSTVKKINSVYFKMYTLRWQFLFHFFVTLQKPPKVYMGIGKLNNKKETHKFQIRIINIDIWIWLMEMTYFLSRKSAYLYLLEKISHFKFIYSRPSVLWRWKYYIECGNIISRLRSLIFKYIC